MRKTMLSVAVTIIIPIGLAYSQGRNALDIYFIDVEGGQSTLFVAPSGESLLMDAGNPGARDVDRIAAAAQEARLKQIDYLVISHYHSDHIGGVAELAARLPIRAFVDYGPMMEQGERAVKVFQTYAAAREKGRHLPVKPGDKVPIAGLDVQVVTSGGDQITTPLPVGTPGAGAPNPLCRDFAPKPEDKTENARSVGIIMRHGTFRMADLGDLTWNKEHGLACPNNLLGTVDVYLTTHHGLNLSGPQVLVHALRPRVAVMNNGPRKGASREAWTIVKTSPGLEDLWQLHYSVQRPPNPAFQESRESGGPDLNVAEQFIANLDETTAHFVKLSARPDGSFTVTNGRTGFSKDYQARRGQ
jgi:beta-lactamase superfamily II metal-dependent hydrolase